MCVTARRPAGGKTVSHISNWSRCGKCARPVHYVCSVHKTHVRHGPPVRRRKNCFSPPSLGGGVVRWCGGVVSRTRTKYRVARGKKHEIAKLLVMLTIIRKQNDFQQFWQHVGKLSKKNKGETSGHFVNYNKKTGFCILLYFLATLKIMKRKMRNSW